jgi:hypothetical protein
MGRGTDSIQGSLARVIRATVASLAISLAFGVAVASATTYYVTPNPQPGADCTTPATACDITAGTSVNDAEVVVLPGDYTVSTGLSTLNPANIHGLDGSPRPRIFSTYGFAAWTLGSHYMPGPGPTITFRHLEIETTGGSGLQTSGNGSTTIDDVVMNATGPGGAGCAPAGSAGTITIRNSVCRGTDRGLGVNCVGCNENVTLRNVTAIGGTYGVAFDSSTGSPSTFNVTATNAIARHTGGTGADVQAAARTTNSSSVINLDHSNYATRDQIVCGTPPCTATVTDPNAAGAFNQTAAPLFVNAAAGDFHQAVGSPTIDAGVNNAANGTSDIDGQQRPIDTTDVGADEIGRATSTAVGCSPASALAGTLTTCTATVTDPGVAPTAPTGNVGFSGGSGNFSGGGTCALAATATPGQASCAVTYTSGPAGTDQISATSHSHSRSRRPPRHQRHPP